jgi:alpha-ribazole phosphatase/probable phosphoglycerate mutase
MLDFDFLPGGYSTRLILIRHGEPEERTNAKCYGSLDIGLSAKGRAQLEAKLSSVRNLTATSLYTSPLKRALESAEIAGAFLRLQPTVSPALREINFGRLEGLNYSEIEEQYPEEYKLWMEHPTKVKFPGGESFSEMKKRVLDYQEQMFCTPRNKTIVLVSHGGTNRILLAHALGIRDEMIFRIDQTYAAMNIIDYFEKYPVVRLLNG